MTYIEELYEKWDIEWLKQEKNKIEKIIDNCESLLNNPMSRLQEHEKEKYLSDIEHEKENLERVKKYLADLLSKEWNT
jgi:hypothetical protein